MKYGRLIGAGILTIGTLAGPASAASPTKGDMDFCNMKAAQVSKASPVQPGAAASRQPAPSATPPGTPVSPGTAAQSVPGTGSAQPGSNPSGGRITDSSSPGIPPSQLGMDSIGETDQRYRQAYLACIADRTKERPLCVTIHLPGGCRDAWICPKGMSRPLEAAPFGLSSSSHAER